MSALRGQLIKNNRKINWIPEHLKEGRFGEWLREIKDWALSRERYWGTPLPVWECQKCAGRLVVGSLEELNKYRADDAVDLILVRHGEAESNAKELCSSYPEKVLNPLTARGRKQVLALAKKIKAQIRREKIAAIYSSDLLRAREAAQILADGLGVKKVILDQRLREIDTGEFNGRPLGEYHGFFGSFKDRFMRPPPGGESWLDVAKRTRDFVADISKKHAGGKIVVVSHMDPLFLIQTSQEVLGEDEVELVYGNVLKNIKNVLDTAEFASFQVNNWPYDEDGDLDLHRPYVDGLLLRCPKCSAKMTRVKDVVDVWFDSGAMPWAQWHFPFGQNKKSEIKNQKLTEDKFPADYICEAVDQTRGWFYTLLAVSTALGEGAPYKNVISLSHVLDEKGEKMSKSKGNVVDPWLAGEKVGFDVLRWYFYTINTPGDNKLFSWRDLEVKKRRLADTVVNSLLFLETYYVKPPQTLAARKDILDGWILSRLEDLKEKVGHGLDSYDVTSAARAIEDFVDDMSNWYIRRSRRKFQRRDMSGEKLAAQETLVTVLKGLAVLLAPFTPFLAEWLYQELRRLTRIIIRTDADAKIRDDWRLDQRKSAFLVSVHLERWPAPQKLAQKSDVRKVMGKARELVALGLAERARAGIRVRQPLNALYVASADYKLVVDVVDVVREELNVKKVVADKKLVKGTVTLDTKLTAELKEEGLARELVRSINDMRKEARLTPQDKIILCYDIRRGGDFKELLARWEGVVKTETRAQEIHFGIPENENFLVHKTWSHDGYEIGVGVKKI